MTVPRRRSLKFRSILTECFFLFPYTYPFCYTKNRPRDEGGFIMIISWWSCRVLPPGPKGNLLFVYKFSLN